MLQFLHEDTLFVSFLCLLIRCIFAIRTTLGRVDIWRTEAETNFSLSYTDVTGEKV